LYAPLLGFNQYCCAFNAGVSYPVKNNRGTNFIQNIRIDGVYRYRQGFHPRGVYGLRVTLQQKAVGAEAVDELRKLPVDDPEGFQRVGRGQSVPRPGDSRHGYFRAQYKRPPHQIYGIGGVQQRSAYSGPLLGLVKSSLAKTALDIARGAYRQVQPSVGHIRLPGKTGVPGTDMGKPLVDFD
jgi:hypothetical protein